MKKWFGLVLFLVVWLSSLGTGYLFDYILGPTDNKTFLENSVHTFVFSFVFVGIFFLIGRVTKKTTKSNKK